MKAELIANSSLLIVFFRRMNGLSENGSRKWNRWGFPNKLDFWNVVVKKPLNVKKFDYFSIKAYYVGYIFIKSNFYRDVSGSDEIQQKAPTDFAGYIFPSAIFS